MGKAVSRFEPTPARSRAECERHYNAVHVPMAQDFLRPMPALLSYHTGRAVAQADIAGGWAQRPRAWRFVVLRFVPGESLEFTPAQSEAVAQDHVNCLYRLRHCELEETIVIDRLCGQWALSKFVIEADRAPGHGPDEAWAAFSGIADRVAELMQDAFGARRLIVNRALNELECEPVDQEGQRPIGLLAEPRRVGYIEAYFDHPRWGREALAPIVPSGALVHSALVDVNLLQVQESTALDRTEALSRRMTQPVSVRG